MLVCQNPRDNLQINDKFPFVITALTDGKGMLSMLRRRAADEKVNVRKSALVALENIIRLNGDSFNQQVRLKQHNIYILCVKCPFADF